MTIRILLSQITLLLVGTAASSLAQEEATPAPSANYKPTRMIEMLPADKRFLAMREQERNPYARRSPSQETISDAGDNAEELQIRETLSSLSVSGQSCGSNGLRILLGDIIIEQGRILPQLLTEQTENLKVIEVSEDSIILGWLDIETAELTGKTMQMTYDLTPSITYALHGQDPANTVVQENGDVTRRMGILRVGQERRKQEQEMAEKDPANRLAPEVYQAGQ